MFSSAVPHLTLTYRIDSELIAIGNTNWQTKNISSVSVDQQQLKFSELEPKFTDQKPTPRTSWGLLLLAVAFSWAMALSTEHIAVIGLALTCASAFGAWFVRHYSQKNYLRTWTKRRDRTAEKHVIWKRLSRSVPTVFSLILESSSGRAVALSTFDNRALLSVHDTILKAMRRTEGSGASGTMRAIDTTAGPIQKQYEVFCHGEIESA